MQILYDMINKVADNTFGEEVTAENIKSYSRHWLLCAEDIKKSFLNQDLPVTADYVQQIINVNREFVRQ